MKKVELGGHVLPGHGPAVTSGHVIPGPGPAFTIGLRIAHSTTTLNFLIILNCFFSYST